MGGFARTFSCLGGSWVSDYSPLGLSAQLSDLLWETILPAPAAVRMLRAIAITSASASKIGLSSRPAVIQCRQLPSPRGHRRFIDHGLHVHEIGRLVTSSYSQHSLSQLICYHSNRLLVQRDWLLALATRLR